MSRVFKILRSGPFANFPLYGKLFTHKSLDRTALEQNEAVLVYEDTVPFEVMKDFHIKTGLNQESDFNDPLVLGWFKQMVNETNVLVIDMRTFSISFGDVETDYLRIDPNDIPTLHTEWIKSNA